MALSPYERMMRRVRKTDTCWLFEGYRNENGHGHVRSKRDGKWTCEKAHRISFMHHKGEIPKGNVVRHTCDVANCVNPDHLILGTQKMNVWDMVMRDRLANQYGPCTGHVDLTPSFDEFDDVPF